MTLVPCQENDVAATEAFLKEADLTRSGIGEPGVRLWLERDPYGDVVGSTGYEVSDDHRHALIRSVAVHTSYRSQGRGSVLARFALAQAAAEGIETAWLFSRRSGPFWQSVGFAPADRDELVAALPDTHQVRMFRRTGQLSHEVAWSRSLASAVGDGSFPLVSVH